MSKIVHFPGKELARGMSVRAGGPPPVKRVRRDGRPARDRNVILPLVVEDVSLEMNGRWLLKDLSFTILPRRRTVILGYNGAGKSLTLRLCHGLIRPTRGRIEWCGPLGNDPEAVARAQAMVFQKPVLLRRSVRDNLLYVLRNRGERGEKARIRVQRVMERCGIAHLAHRPARTLSGGEQQKLALARAWLLKPSILFLDEPTAALDPASTLDVERIINELHVATTTIFFSTHDMAQARRLADYVLFIHHGRIIEQGPAEAFFIQPRTEAARAFLAGELMP
jgi:tungstate transport system ATP-binding protein